MDGKINNVVEKLSDGGPQQVPIFSPDGNQVAFVRDNNIFLVKLLYGNSESQVTEDGSRNEVLNGIPDWVYEEEFAFNRALNSVPTARCWLSSVSTNGKFLYTFPVFAGEVPHIAPYEKYPGEYTYKYPKTGEKNSKVSVHTFDIKSKVTRKINLPLEEGGYIPRIRFTQDPNKLAIMTLNRHQNRFDLYFADLAVPYASWPYVMRATLISARMYLTTSFSIRRLSVLSVKEADTTTCTGTI